MWRCESLYSIIRLTITGYALLGQTTAKPVKILSDGSRVRPANQVNLISVTRIALLLLPPRFVEEDLYKTIIGISYLGDRCMSLEAENPNKVKNIVQKAAQFSPNIHPVN